MKITALIVSYNRYNLLLECLDSIFDQSLKPDNVIIFDNGSSFSFSEIQNLYPNIKIMISSKNLGASGGFYYGLLEALKDDAEYIWIMDDDVIASKTALENLANKIKLVPNENFSFLASSVKSINNEPMNVPSISESVSKNGYRNAYKFLEFGLVEIKSATYVSILINKDALTKFGLPFEGFFIWSDDTEFTHRLTLNYGPAYLVGESIVIHKRSNPRALSIATENDKSRIKLMYYLHRNQLVYYKTYSTKKRFITIFIMQAVLLLKIILMSKHKFLKLGILLKANLAFVFGKWNRKSYKNRFKNANSVFLKNKLKSYEITYYRRV